MEITAVVSSIELKWAEEKRLARSVQRTDGIIQDLAVEVVAPLVFPLSFCPEAAEQRGAKKELCLLPEPSALLNGVLKLPLGL